MRIVLLLEYRRCELFLLVIKRSPPLRINSVKVLSNHFDTRWRAVLNINSLSGSVAFSDYRFSPRRFPDATRPEHAPADSARDYTISEDSQIRNYGIYLPVRRFQIQIQAMILRTTRNHLSTHQPILT